MEYLNKNISGINLMKIRVLHYSECIKVQLQFILTFRSNRTDCIIQQNVGNDTFRERSTSILKLSTLF